MAFSHRQEDIEVHPVLYYLYDYLKLCLFRFKEKKTLFLVFRLPGIYYVTVWLFSPKLTFIGQFYISICTDFR